MMMLYRELLLVRKKQNSHLNMISELRTELKMIIVGYDKIWHSLSMSKYKSNYCPVLLESDDVSRLRN